MNTGPLIMGFVICAGIARSIVTGSATADGKGLLREAEPVYFWTAVGIMGAAAMGMFYLPWRG